MISVFNPLEVEPFSRSEDSPVAEAMWACLFLGDRNKYGLFFSVGFPFQIKEPLKNGHTRTCRFPLLA